MMIAPANVLWKSMPCTSGAYSLLAIYQLSFLDRIKTIVILVYVVRIILSYFNLLLHLSRQVLTLLPDERETLLLLLQHSLPLYAEYRTATTTFMGIISLFSHSTRPTFFGLFLEIHFEHVFLCKWAAILEWDVFDYFRPSYGTVMPSDVVQGRFKHSTQLLSSTVNTEGASFPIRGEVQFSPECSSLKTSKTRFYKLPAARFCQSNQI